ncbi:hypothetical protein [Corallococcus sicarius]|nr:hypothetical protein [Corallococcus sicarius]
MASPDSEAAAPKEPPRSGSSLARLEVATLALLPRSGGGEAEGSVPLEPKRVLDGGPEFGLNLGAAEARWRLLGGELYAMGTGGTLPFPTPEGTLRPGAFASMGLGVDDAH